MKKVLYISVYNSNPEVLPFDGVMKKIATHIRVLKGFGNSIDYIESDGIKTFFVTGDIKDEICTFSNSGYKYFNEVMFATAKYIVDKNLNYDYVYIRYDSFNYNGIRALSKIHKHSKRIYLEIPTYYGSPRNLKGHIKTFFTRFLKKYIYKIVINSNEKKIYGIETLMITNGVEVDKIEKRKPTYSDSINVALVASISGYHGVDKIIKAVETEREYENIIFHIAGDGPKLPEYIQLVKSKELQNRIIFYGKLTGKELDELYNICEIGISSLANKEAGVLFSSTLKSKEYLAKGLPVVSDVMLDVFYEKTQYFFCQLKNDFNLKELKEFYISVYDTRNKQEIIDEIREYAEQTCDVRKLMRKLEDDYNKSNEN